MKKVSFTVDENEARLLRELLKHQVRIHNRNAQKLERLRSYKDGGFIAGDRERRAIADKAQEALINVHKGCANSFNIILENISGRMFQKGIKFDPINFLKTKILRQ